MKEIGMRMFESDSSIDKGLRVNTNKNIFILSLANFYHFFSI